MLLGPLALPKISSGFTPKGLQGPSQTQRKIPPKSFLGRCTKAANRSTIKTKWTIPDDSEQARFIVLSSVLHGDMKPTHYLQQHLFQMQNIPGKGRNGVKAGQSRESQPGQRSGTITSCNKNHHHDCRITITARSIMVRPVPTALDCKVISGQ